MLPKELTTIGVQAQLQAFESNIQAEVEEKLLDKALDKSLGLEEITIEDLIELHFFHKDEDTPFKWEPTQLDDDKPNADKFTSDILDKHLRAKVVIHIAGELKRGSVRTMKCDEDVNSYGNHHR